MKATRRSQVKNLLKILNFQNSEIQPLTPNKKGTPPTEKKDTLKPAKCRQCNHFFITWERSVPYGCEAYGFKSAKLPSISVKEVSGEPCNLFKQKQTPAKY